MGADKLWLDAAGRPLVRRTLDALAAAAIFERTVVVAPHAAWDRLRTEAAAAGLGDIALVEGGAHRQDSVRAALPLCGDAEVVCVHDAARPLCPPALFGAVVEAARREGAATAAVPVVDTVKRVDAAGTVLETLDRGALVAVQTPQAFVASLLREAHERAAGAPPADDDCVLVERLGRRVVTVPGDPANLKVTTPADLAVVVARLGAVAVEGGR